MAFWYDIKDKKYAENERKSWLRAYLEKLVSNLRTEQNTKFSSHTTGDAYRHSAGDVDCSNSKNVQEVLDSCAEQISSLSQTMLGKVDKITGKGLSSNDYTDDEKADVAKIKNIQTNLDNKASVGEVLRVNVSNNEFTPTQPYHPATKKYVDDNKTSVVDSFDSTSTTNALSANKGRILNLNLNNKASIGEVLRVNVSNNEFTPIQPYHPATKKYVDDSVATKVDKEDGKVLSSNDYTDDEKADVAKINTIQLNLDNKASIGEVLRVNVSNNEFTPIQPYHPATKKYVDDNKTSVVDSFDSTSTTNALSANKGRILNLNLNNKASIGEVLRVNVSNNEFTPIQPYHPATKKYVDDSVAALKTELVALINNN